MSNIEVENPPNKSKLQNKNPGFKKNIYEYVREFSNKTSIHGFHYIFEQRRPIVEKIFWVILFSSSLYICLKLVTNNLQEFKESTNMIRLVSKPTTIWEIPFPAITICPITKIRQRVYNYTNFYSRGSLALLGQENMTQEEWTTYFDTYLLCHTYAKTGKRNKTTNMKTIKSLLNLASPFSETFISCLWSNTEVHCQNLFTPTLTEDGKCYTFNMLDRNELYTKEAYLPDDFMGQQSNSGWTLEEGYPKEATYPRRIFSAGSQSGISFYLAENEQDLDYICRGPVQGFKVTLHHPGEVPRTTSKYVRAPLGQDVLLAVQPDLMTASEELRSYAPERRQCFFSEERNLKFFKVYTQQNCEVECLANYTLSKCGCVAYYMLREENTKICGSGSVECLEHGRNIVDFNATLNCKCLPSCFSIIYNTEISQADLHLSKFLEFELNDKFRTTGIQMTALKIFFKDTLFFSFERKELFSLKELLVNCGGILGLFIGFSLLTVAEIIYFFTIRLIANVNKYGIYFWSGSEELVDND